VSSSGIWISHSLPQRKTFTPAPHWKMAREGLAARLSIFSYALENETRHFPWVRRGLSANWGQHTQFTLESSSIVYLLILAAGSTGVVAAAGGAKRAAIRTALGHGV